MDTPLVSILIPVYNRENFIEDTIKSAVNQTYKNKEVIIVDNKSNDRTYSVLKNILTIHPDVKIYQNDSNIGPVRNWRKCIDYAKGEYIKFLFSDDLITPDCLEKCLPYLIENKDVGFVFTGAEVFNDVGEKKRKAHFIGKTGIYDSKLFINGSLFGRGFPVSPVSAVFRRRDVEKNLLIDIPNKMNNDYSQHGAGNDVLIYLLIAKEYPKFTFINETLTFFRKHKKSITISFASMDSDFLVTSYLGAKAFFVKNHVFDIASKKKFNSKLFLHNIAEKFIRGKTYNDHYYDDALGMDFLYLIKITFEIFLNRVYIKVTNKLKKNC